MIEPVRDEIVITNESSRSSLEIDTNEIERQLKEGRSLFEILENKGWALRVLLPTKFKNKIFSGPQKFFAYHDISTAVPDLKIRACVVIEYSPGYFYHWRFFGKNGECNTVSSRDFMIERQMARGLVWVLSNPALVLYSSKEGFPEKK